MNLLHIAMFREFGMAEKNAGVIAFSRMGDPEHGDFQDAEVIAVFGAVDVSALGG